MTPDQVKSLLMPLGRCECTGWHPLGSIPATNGHPLLVSPETEKIMAGRCQNPATFVTACEHVVCFSCTLEFCVFCDADDTDTQNHYRQITAPMGDVPKVASRTRQGSPMTPRTLEVRR